MKEIEEGKLETQKQNSDKHFWRGYWHGISCMTHNDGNKTARSILKYKPVNDYEKGKVYSAIDWLVKNGCKLSKRNLRVAREMNYI